VPHRPATVRREPVPVDVDDVDIHGAQRKALIENSSAFIHQRIDAAIRDLIVGDLALGDAGLGGPLAHQIRNLGIGDGAAVFVVLVPAGAALLAVAPQLAQAVLGQRLAYAGLLQVAVFLADSP